MTLRSAYEHVVLLDEEQNPVGTLQKRVAHHEHTPAASRVLNMAIQLRRRLPADATFA